MSRNKPVQAVEVVLALLVLACLLWSVVGVHASSQEPPGAAEIQAVELTLGVDGVGPALSGQRLRFTWRVVNRVLPEPLGGAWRVRLDDQPFAVAGLGTVPAVGRGQAASGGFSLQAPSPGSHTITLELLVPGTGRGRGGRGGIAPRVRASASVDVLVARGITDVDLDELDDALEARLLDTYRPQLRFSRNTFYGIDRGAEPYAPTDVATYLRRAQIAAGDTVLAPLESAPGNFDRLLQMHHVSGDTCRESGSQRTCSSSVIDNRRKTAYRIHPAESTRSGTDWLAVTSARNVGLYGHVVPYDPATSQADFQRLLDDDDWAALRGRQLVKVEYWQFFAFNGGPATHEGDWTTVQLLVSLDEALTPEDRIIAVWHFCHGVSFRYRVATTTARVALDGGRVREFRGPNYDKPIGFGAFNNADIDLGIRWAQDHKVRLFRDPDSGAYTHPVVYVESQTHEFWPSPDWNYYGAPTHNGEDEARSYLASRPPNLGEVEHPMRETPLAAHIMQFSGYWGRSSTNGPPEGPALHGQWTWPKGSAIRWLLGNLTY